jgi:membrane fusion protein
VTKGPLFRAEAVNASQTKWLGEILLVQPLSFSVFTTLTAAMASLVVCFIMLGSYTQRSTISGQLAPDVGLLKIYAAQTGTVLEKRVSEGQWLRKGEAMYLVSGERQNGDRDGIQAKISRQVRLRTESLRNELMQTRRLQQDEQVALRKKIDGLFAEQANVVRQLAVQGDRITFAEAAMKRYSELLGKGYVSAEMAQQKQSDLLDQRNRMQTLERDKITIDRELESNRSELTSLPLRQRNQLEQIDRLIANGDQELIESEGKRQITITAPESGIVTAVTAEVGQLVDGSKPMAAIIPSSSVLQAQLFAPSRAIGFVRAGDHVLLRYQSYPYQKFGHARGVVASISRTALSASELIGAATTPGGDEPLYKIIVTLERQTITAYGEQQQLQTGMRVEADILHEKRKLYEWVLEPLYSLTGKL